MALTIHTPEDFALVIEHAVKQRQLSYIDAVTDFCQRRNLEPSVVAPFISPKMKSAMLIEGQALHLLKKQNRLSFD